MLEKFKVTAKHSAIYGLGNLFAKLAGLILLPIYTNRFTIDEYGVVGMLEITFQILASVFGLSLFIAFFRWYWDKEFLQKQKSIYFTVTSFVICLSFLMCLVLIIFGRPLSNIILSSPEYSLILQLSFIASGLEAVGVMPSTLLRLQGRAFQYTYTYGLRLCLNLALNIVFIVYMGLGLESIYYSAIISGLVYLILLTPYSLKNMEMKVEITLLKKMIVFSLPLLFSTMASIILTVTDRYMLRFLTGLEDVGTYSLSFKLANTVRFLLILPVNLAVMPVFFRIMNDPNSKYFFARFTTYFSYVTAYAVLAMSLFSEVIVKLFASNSDYWGSIRLVPILSLAVFFGMLKDMVITGLHIAKKTRIIATVIVLLAVLNIVLNALLIPSYHDLGASIATLITQILFFVILYFIAQKAFHIPYELGRIGKLIIVAGLVYFIAVIIPFRADILHFLFQIAIFALFPLILFIFRFYNTEELKKLLGFVRKWKKLGNLKDNITEFLKQTSEN